MEHPVIRPATSADAEAFFGRPTPISFRGFVALLHGKVVGIGGLNWEAGRLVLFSDMKPEMRRFRKAIAVAIRLLVGYARAQGRPVYAVASPTEPTAEKLLSRLGFRQTGVTGARGPVWMLKE